ncbi:hypothetical protein [Devosia beringensis]|uniref:hypothetical protein n=1 Tax=Devosia beringensis TaxID=2657486 RepID=UPI00186BA5E7|nr:hypothetical protein [Devosia beringensis]
MPHTLLAPALYIDEADIDELVTALSERIRRDHSLRPAMDGLIGNRWGQAELAAGAFLRATLFFDHRPAVDGDWLARALRLLDTEAIERLGAILLDCAFVALPLHSAGLIGAIGDELVDLLKAVVAQDGVTRQRLLLAARARLAAGALMSRL